MFEITERTPATLKTLTPRTEKHGEDEVSAVSLGLSITGPNTMLDSLQPGLRDALYKAKDDEPLLPGIEATTPLLRSAGIEAVKLTAKFEGWTLRIDAHIDDGDPFVLGACKVDKFAVVPSQGGSIELLFRVGTSDIDQTEAGWLFGHLSQDVWITLTAPTKTEGEAIDGTVGHPGAKRGDEDQGELLDDGDDGPGDSDHDGGAEGESPDGDGGGDVSGQSGEWPFPRGEQTMATSPESDEKPAAKSKGKGRRKPQTPEEALAATEG